MKPQGPVRNATRRENDRGLDFDVLPTLVGYHLRQAQISVFNDFVRSMNKEQISPGQFGVLTLIGSNPGLSQSALARAVGIERSTMVAVIDALEVRGLVARQPSPVDRRSYALILSGTGEKLLQTLRPLVLGHDGRMTENLTAQERDALIHLLSKLKTSSG